MLSSFVGNSIHFLPWQVLGISIQFGLARFVFPSSFLFLVFPFYSFILLYSPHPSLFSRQQL